MLVLYHNADADGYCAKQLAQLVYPECIPYGISYGDKDEIPIMQSISEYVFIDICPSVAWVDEIYDEDISITIYDHHMTSYEPLQDDTRVKFYYDINRCGSKIFYDKHKKIHTDYLDKIVFMINQFDLFLMKPGDGTIDDVLYLNQYVSRQREFINNLEYMLKIGKILYKQQLPEIKEYMKKAKIIKVLGHTVMILEGAKMTYQLQYLCNEKYPEVDFLISYFYYKKDCMCKTSNRTALSKQDTKCVFDFLKNVVGVEPNGHKHANGCVMEMKKFNKIFSDE